MSILIILLFVLTLLLSSFSAESADWQYYGSVKEGSSLYYDRESVTTAGNIVKVRQKEVYNEQVLYRLRERLGDRYENLKELVRVIEIDCHNHQAQVKSVTFQDSSGDAIGMTRYHESENWVPIRQQPDLRILHSLYCYTEWIPVCSSKDDEDYFLGSESIHTHNSLVTFWMKGVSNKTKKEVERDRIAIKCENDTYSVRDFIKYKPDGSISEVYSYDNRLIWSKISANSVIGGFHKLLCADKKPRDNLKEYLKKEANSAISTKE